MMPHAIAAWCAHALLQAQVQARVRKWYQLLQTFKKQPDSIEFVYLRHADPDSTQWNPYNIEVVPHAGVKVCGGRWLHSLQCAQGA